MQYLRRHNLFLRGSSAIVLASLALPIVGCGSPAPPPQSVPPPPSVPQANSSLTTKQKLTLLAGAAALYYVYNRYKKQNEAKLAEQNVQYYRAKNGRIYYRDKTKLDAKGAPSVVWVTPLPSDQPNINIPEQEAADYREFQGYNNQNTGKTLADVLPAG